MILLCGILLRINNKINLKRLNYFYTLNLKDVDSMLFGYVALLVESLEYGLLDAFDLQSSGFSFGLLLAFRLKDVLEAWFWLDRN